MDPSALVLRVGGVQRVRCGRRWCYVMKSGVDIVTFGGGQPRWERAARRVGREARASGLFNEVRVDTQRTFRRDHESFAARHRKILSPGVRGFGYWIWKPLIIRTALAQSNGSVLYVDAGTTLNLQRTGSRSRLAEYVDMAHDCGGIADRISEYKACFWTKADTAQRLAMSGETLEAGQLAAGFMLLKKTPENLDLLDQWLKIAVEDDYHFIDDSPSVAPEISGFREHRHDQSILHGLWPQAGLGHVVDETYFSPDWSIDGRDYPIWATRHGWGAPLSTRFRHNPRLSVEVRLTRLRLDRLVNSITGGRR